MGRAAAVKSSSLTLGWALNQLNRQLGSSGCSCEGFEAVAKAKPRLPQEPTGSAGSLPGCMTPTGADSGAHSSAEASSSQQQAHSQPPHRTLSVHWAEALEQHSQRPHTPLHTLCAPDKPCLKTQQTSFPFLEEAAQLEGLMRRPRAMLAALQLEGGGGSGTPLQAHQPAAKKRSRMAAFGQ